MNAGSKFEVVNSRAKINLPTSCLPEGIWHHCRTFLLTFILYTAKDNGVPAINWKAMSKQPTSTVMGSDKCILHLELLHFWTLTII
jgi:hypothetical protein